MKFLFTGVYPEFHGGLERFAQRTAELIRSRGMKVDVTGAPPADVSCYDCVLMQKLPPGVQDLRRLKEQCGSKLHFFAHDHELYCLRRHYYTPFRNNCSRAYSALFCRLCAMVTRPQWVPRALTRPMAGYLEEMKSVHIFAPSRFTRDALINNGIPCENITLLAPFFYNELPPPEKCASFENRQPGAPLRMLFLGQLVAGKGLHLIIEALKSADFPYSLKVVGSGRDEAMLKGLAAGMKEISFEGWQSEPERYFAEADVVLFPSVWNEPYGLTGVEGALHNLPCVAFGTGGVTDWLEDRKTGLLVPPGNVSAFIDALRELQSTQGLLGTLGGNARAFAESTFAPDRFLINLKLALQAQDKCLT